MKPSVILYAVFLTVSLGIKAQQADTVSYEVTKNMPVFYEQLKQQLTYPAAWGKLYHKRLWEMENRNTKYSDGVHAEICLLLPRNTICLSSEQSSGRDMKPARYGLMFRNGPAYRLIYWFLTEKAFSGCDNAARSWSTLFHRQRENGMSFRSLSGNIG